MSIPAVSKRSDAVPLPLWVRTGTPEVLTGGNHCVFIFQQRARRGNHNVAVNACCPAQDKALVTALIPSQAGWFLLISRD